jgi:uncharacterized membrane protein YphA (DoxX/SURF4 family)
VRHTHLVRSFLALWWVLGGVLLLLSIQTVRSALVLGGPHPDMHAVLIGSVEAVAALLFLIPPLMRVGGAGLLFTFAVAFLLHSLHGQFAAPLLVYAAGVVFIMVHGPVPVQRSVVS